MVATITMREVLVELVVAAMQGKQAQPTQEVVVVVELPMSMEVMEVAAS